jgi:hypothetical protein
MKIGDRVQWPRNLTSEGIVIEIDNGFVTVLNVLDGKHPMYSRYAQKELVILESSDSSAESLWSNYPKFNPTNFTLQEQQKCNAFLVDLAMSGRMHPVCLRLNPVTQ